MSVLAFESVGAERRTRLPGPWLRSFTLVRVDGTYEARMPSGEETLAVLLAGTVDLFAGGSSWLQRGLRATPFAGRPCGLYLPPEVVLRVAGQGELLLVAGKRPEGTAAAPAQPERVSMGLLQLAGSGKAYDARTGTWELLERFPSSPEAVLPRGIETKEVGGGRVERVFSYAFKALALCLDECALAPGQRIALPRPLTPPGVRYGDELALFVRTAGEATIDDGESRRATGDAVVLVNVAATVNVTAGSQPVYVAAVWAGAKPS